MAIVFQTLDLQDDPNTGRVKINLNFAQLSGITGSSGSSTSSPYIGGVNNSINTVSGNNVSSGFFSVVTNGENNTNLGNHSSIVGGYNNKVNSLVTGSTILGGSSITATTSETVYGVNFNASGKIYSGGTDLGTIISSIASGTGNTSGAPIYTGASTTTVTVNQIPSGTDISGVSLSYLLENIYAPFVAPTFSAFAISGQLTTVEAGTVISAGSKTFTWSTTTPSNINPNTIIIKDQTANITLASGLSNDGTENIVISATTLAGITSQVYRILATPSQGSQIQRDFTINSYYKEFYGPVSGVPTNSVTARALPSNRLTNAGNVFTLSTGTVEKIFVVVLPTAKTIVSIIDTNTNVDLTSSFTLTNFSVNDAGGNAYTANCYSLTQSVPFAVSHNLQITTN